VTNHDSDAAVYERLRRLAPLFAVASIISLDERDQLAQYATFGIYALC
jgi:hypothetical protein